MKKSGGYEVRGPGLQGGYYLGHRTELESARKLLTEHLGVRTQDLEMPGEPREEPRQWNTWRSTGYMFISSRNGKFRVMAGSGDSGRYLGTHDSLKEAFAVLADHDLSKCVKKNPSRDVQVFQAVFPLFRNWLPVDYHSHVDMDRAMRGTVTSKCLNMLMIWGKETEWRMKLVELQNAFSARDRLLLQQLLSAHGPSAKAAGQRIWNTLGAAVKYMSTIDRSWSNRHLHFRVGRALSWLPLLQKWGVLSKTERGPLNFGSSENYKLEPYDNVKMLQTFQRIERFWIAHFDLYGPAENFAEYEAYVENVANASCGMVFDDPEGYICRWSARAAQASLRHGAGYSDFHVPANCSTDRFADAFPDNAHHVQDFATHLRKYKIHDLARALGYDQSLFFLTMFQCLLLDPAICCIPVDVLTSEQFARAVRRIKRSTLDGYGHVGLPAAICVQAALECM